MAVAVSGVRRLAVVKGAEDGRPKCKGSKALVCADCNEHDHDVVANNPEGEALQDAVDYEGGEGCDGSNRAGFATLARGLQPSQAVVVRDVAFGGLFVGSRAASARGRRLDRHEACVRVSHVAEPAPMREDLACRGLGSGKGAWGEGRALMSATEQSRNDHG